MPPFLRNDKIVHRKSSNRKWLAALAELVDAPDLGSGSERSESSSLLCRTTDSVRLFLIRTIMKRKLLLSLTVFVLSLLLASCDTKAVISPSVQVSSWLYRTSIEGVQDTITLRDSLSVGDTVRMPVILNGYYDYLTSFVASADTAKVNLWFAWDDEFNSCLMPNAAPEHGVLVFKADSVYACVTTLVYVPTQSGTHRIDMSLNSSAELNYSNWSGFFLIGVK